MSKFFSNKKILIIIVGAIVTVMVGLLIGSNIVNTMKAKEKAAEKAKIEKTIEERKDIEEKIKKAEKDDSLEENHYTKEYNFPPFEFFVQAYPMDIHNVLCRHPENRGHLIRKNVPDRIRPVEQVRFGYLAIVCGDIVYEIEFQPHLEIGMS